MFRSNIRLILVCCAAISSCAAAPADLFAKTEVLRAVELAADWQLAHPSPHPATDWTQATWYNGVTALADIAANPSYWDAMRAMGHTNGWRLGARADHADDECVAQTYLALYRRSGDKVAIADTQAHFDAILAHPPGTDLSFQGEGKQGAAWSWCDSLFMAPPAWLELAALTGDKRYRDYAVERWWMTSDFLYDPTEHLFYRDSRFFERRESNGNKIFWSRGNGWVLAGLVHMLEALPANDPVRPRFERQFREMTLRMIDLQQPDGLWRASLLDPASYPLKEVSGSAFHCYALTWGVNHGLLDPSTTLPIIRRAWTALRECLGDDGRLTHVQPIGANPKDFPAESTECYGVGAFLLAGSEVYRCELLRPTPAKTETDQ